MERISILQFRRQAGLVIRRVQQGKRFLLTYRGKPVLRLEPIQKQPVNENDLFYNLDRLAAVEGKPLSNEEIDRIVYAD